MALHQSSALPYAALNQLRLVPAGRFPRMRALAWDGSLLYASQGYRLLRADLSRAVTRWQVVADYRPSWWRNAAASSRLASRLLREGFHALVALPTGELIAAGRGVIVTLRPGEAEFRVSHRIQRGSRPLHLASSHGVVFWGEYFDNPHREEVQIYASGDRGASWEVAYSFGRSSIRHVHNIVYDRWEDCLWILTGDEGPECRILRASCDLSAMEVVLSGGQQVRAAAAVPTEEGLYFSTDTPKEQNHIYLLDRNCKLTALAQLSSSSIYGCAVADSLFFSTMVEPSPVNSDAQVRIYGRADGANWQGLLEWKKDRWPMRFFQYGNVFLPDGDNTSGVLAVSTIALESADMETSLWRIQSATHRPR